MLATAFLPAFELSPTTDKPWKWKWEHTDAMLFFFQIFDVISKAAPLGGLKHNKWISAWETDG